METAQTSTKGSSTTPYPTQSLKRVSFNRQCRKFLSTNPRLHDHGGRLTRHGHAILRWLSLATHPSYHRTFLYDYEQIGEYTGLGKINARRWMAFTRHLYIAQFDYWLRARYMESNINKLQLGSAMGINHKTITKIFAEETYIDQTHLRHLNLRNEYMLHLTLGQDIIQPRFTRLSPVDQEMLRNNFWLDVQQDLLDVDALDLTLSRWRIRAIPKKHYQIEKPTHVSVPNFDIIREFLRCRRFDI